MAQVDVSMMPYECPASSDPCRIGTTQHRVVDDSEGHPTHRSKVEDRGVQAVHQVGSNSVLVMVEVNLAMLGADGELLNRTHEVGLDPLDFDLAEVLLDVETRRRGPADVLGPFGQQSPISLLSQFITLSGPERSHA